MIIKGPNLLDKTISLIIPSINIDDYYIMYKYILNPINKNKVLINSPDGIEILKTYIRYLRGGAAASDPEDESNIIEFLIGANHVIYYDILLPNGLSKQIILLGESHGKPPKICTDLIDEEKINNLNKCIEIDDFIVNIIEKCSETSQCVDFFNEHELTKGQQDYTILKGGGLTKELNVHDSVYNRFKRCSEHSDPVYSKACEWDNFRSHNFDIRFKFKKNSTIKVEAEDKLILDYLMMGRLYDTTLNKLLKEFKNKIDRKAKIRKNKKYAPLSASSYLPENIDVTISDILDKLKKLGLSKWDILSKEEPQLRLRDKVKKYKEYEVTLIRLSTSTAPYKRDKAQLEINTNESRREYRFILSELLLVKHKLILESIPDKYKSVNLQNRDYYKTLLLYILGYPIGDPEEKFSHYDNIPPIHDGDPIINAEHLEYILQIFIAENIVNRLSFGEDMRYFNIDNLKKEMINHRKKIIKSYTKCLSSNLININLRNLFFSVNLRSFISFDLPLSPENAKWFGDGYFSYGSQEITLAFTDFYTLCKIFSVFDYSGEKRARIPAGTNVIKSFTPNKIIIYGGDDHITTLCRSLDLMYPGSLVYESFTNISTRHGQKDPDPPRRRAGHLTWDGGDEEEDPIHKGYLRHRINNKVFSISENSMFNERSFRNLSDLIEDFCKNRFILLTTEGNEIDFNEYLRNIELDPPLNKLNKKSQKLWDKTISLINF
tara:strand:+ start:590 stop:2746 length:2157 start_codon:yes stop_codon:yes gene_type:complete